MGKKKKSKPNSYCLPEMCLKHEDRQRLKVNRCKKHDREVSRIQCAKSTWKQRIFPETVRRAHLGGRRAAAVIETLGWCPPQKEALCFLVSTSGGKRVK